MLSRKQSSTVRSCVAEASLIRLVLIALIRVLAGVLQWHTPERLPRLTAWRQTVSLAEL
jgi:hypothetical protein